MIKNLKKNIIIIIFLSIIITFWLVKDDFQGITHKLLNLNWYWFSGAIVTLVLSFIFMALSLRKIVLRYNQNYTFKEAIVASGIISFMSNITPGNAGAPPATVYMLKQKKLNGRQASHIAVLFVTLYKISFILLITLAIAANFFFDYFKDDGFSRLAVTLSYWIVVLILGGLLLIVYNAKANKWLFTKGIKLLAKVKIVKDKKATIKKWDQYIDDFIDVGRDLRSDKQRIVISLIYYILSLILLMMVPFFCIKGVAPYSEMTFSISLVIALYVALISTVVPIPGSAGGTEVAFVYFYTKFVPSITIATTSLLLYRLLTYHLVVLVGGIIFLFFERNHVLQKNRIINES